MVARQEDPPLGPNLARRWSIRLAGTAAVPGLAAGASTGRGLARTAWQSLGAERAAAADGRDSAASCVRRNDELVHLLSGNHSRGRARGHTAAPARRD